MVMHLWFVSEYFAANFIFDELHPISCIGIVYTQLNGSKYYYLTLSIARKYQ